MTPSVFGAEQVAAAIERHATGRTWEQIAADLGRPGEGERLRRAAWRLRSRPDHLGAPPDEDPAVVELRSRVAALERRLGRLEGLDVAPEASGREQVSPAKVVTLEKDPPGRSDLLAEVYRRLAAGPDLPDAELGDCAPPDDPEDPTAIEPDPQAQPVGELDDGDVDDVDDPDADPEDGSDSQSERTE